MGLHARLAVVGIDDGIGRNDRVAKTENIVVSHGQRRQRIPCCQRIEIQQRSRCQHAQHNSQQQSGDILDHNAPSVSALSVTSSEKVPTNEVTSSM